MGILIPLVVILFSCLIIWRACDGFELASDYLGRNMSEGVRGGTINAISSSLPELLTTLIALFLLSDAEGFSVGIGTTAGSALFNGMIIPAVCILSVVGMVVAGVRVNSVNVSLKVLLRDGLTLIFCEAVLIVTISGSALHWWQGLVLMALYVSYFTYMIGSMKRVDTDKEDKEQEDDDVDEPKSLVAAIFYWLSFGPLLDLELLLVRNHHRNQIKEEKWNGWPLLLVSSGVMGVACLMLVKACEWLGTGSGNTEHAYYELFGYQFSGLGMPAMFVAVIFASMATSVPDTVISIRDARDGDYDDAVANALGSNIFDICFALGFPLFLYTLIHGPIQMDPKTVAFSGELRLLLFLLTIIGFAVYYIGRRGTTPDGVRYVEMKRNKAFMLLSMYAIFAIYVVARGIGAHWTEPIAEFLRATVALLPSL
jgi:sodium/potassium/calcium exchanger 5